MKILEEKNGLRFEEIEPQIFLATFLTFSKEKEANAAQARFYLEMIDLAAKEYASDKIYIINDTTQISKFVRGLSSSARQSYMEAYSVPQIGLVAMVGFGSWLKNFILVLARVANRTAQTAFFDTQEEALEWIHKKAGSTS